jgi:hypothetical protein
VGRAAAVAAAAGIVGGAAIAIHNRHVKAAAKSGHQTVTVKDLEKPPGEEK